MKRPSTGRLASSQRLSTDRPVNSQGVLAANRSTSGWSPCSRASVNAGSFMAAAAIAPDLMAASRCGDPPTSLMVTSLRDRPSWRSASEAALSLSEPKLDTPTVPPLRSAALLHQGVGEEDEAHHVAQRGDDAQVAALAVDVGDAREPDVHDLQLAGAEREAALGAAAHVHDRDLEAALGVEAAGVGEVQRQGGVDQGGEPDLELGRLLRGCRAHRREQEREHAALRMLPWCPPDSGRPTERVSASGPICR